MNSLLLQWLHHCKNTRVGLTNLGYLSCNSRQQYYTVKAYGKRLEAMPNVSNCKLLKGVAYFSIVYQHSAYTHALTASKGHLPNYYLSF